MIVNGRRCWISLSIILATAGACRQASRTDSGPVTAGPADGKVEQRRSGLTALSRTGWVASASPTGTPANAIDGSATTRWTTTSIQANGNFFQVDLGAQRTFTEIRMDTTTTATDFPRSFNVGVSNDGSTFTTVASAMGTSAVVTVAFASQTARYIRVTLANLPAGQTNAWSIYEFNVYDASLARTGWTATALTTAPGTTTGGALDGSTTTRWSSTSGTSHQFQVDMLALQTFNQITLDAGSSTSGNFVRGYTVSVSNNTTASPPTASFAQVATGTGTSRFVVINFAMQQARHIRINSTNATAFTWSIEEMNVLGQPTVATTHQRSAWTATATTAATGTTVGGAIDGSTTTRWTANTVASMTFYQVDMGTYRLFNQITIDAGTMTGNFPRSYKVETSNNASTWTQIAAGTNAAVLLTVNVQPQTARHIKISLTAANPTGSPWSIQELNVSGPGLSRTGWVASASPSSTTDVPGNAVDGSATSRWDNGANQTNGQTFTLDMGTAQVVNQLTLDAGSSTGNYPRGYSVALSSDGTTFGTPVATGTGTTQLVTINFLTQTARAIRITQTGTASSNHWSIHEINVWRIAQPCDTVTCTPSDQCHLGVCDANTGVCSNPNKPNGTTCDNGLCQTGETCQNGTCTGTPVTCTALDQCHTVGTCNPATGICSNPNKTNGTMCDNGLCQTNETCQNGTCTGTPVTCTALDQCHTVGTCNPTTGACSNPNKTNGATCDNGLCQTNETCQNGTCTGTPVTCTALDQCHTAGTCNPATGACSNPNKTNGSTCDNGLCQTNETCQNGTCTGTPVTCAADQCHDAGACNPTTGCPAPKPNGTACDDGNPCTEFDGCIGGTCQGAQPHTCVSPDVCQDAGTCNPAATSPLPPSTQDLIAWWKLDGDGTDATGGGHDLDEGGAVRAPGRVGYGMKFDGSSCMSAPIWDDARMQTTSGLTLMAWINPNDPAGCPYPDQYGQRAVMGRGWDYSLAVMCMYPSPGPGFTGAVRRANAQTWGWGGAWGQFPPDEWHHFAMTWDHQRTYSYLDGKLFNVVEGPPDNSDWDPQFTIGCMTSYYWSGDEHIKHFKGTVDEAMLYGRALSPEEIWSYYAAADPCPHAHHPDGEACLYSHCSQGDTCSSGTCGGGQPVVCTAPDSCHEPGTCVWWAGCVEAPAKSDGAICSDGQQCTQGETCQAGSCQAPAGAPPTILNLPVADLGNLGGGYASAQDINNAGVVVGSSTVASGESHAFRWSVEGAIGDLGLPYPGGASGINDRGDIAGSMQAPGGWHAFRYLPGFSEIQDLGLVGDGSVSTWDLGFPFQGSFGRELNNVGQVVGNYTNQGGIYGFRYSDGFGGGTFEDIGTLEGGLTYGWGIDDNGTVVGSSWVAGTPQENNIRRLGHAVMFENPIAGLVDMNDLIDPLLGWTLIQAIDIAGDYIVGTGDLNGKLLPFRYRISNHYIEPISGGWAGFLYGNDVNRSGDVVGWGALDAAGTQFAAYVYTDQLGFKRLNEIVDPSLGWDLRIATSINDAGMIVGPGAHGGITAPYRVQLPSGHDATCGARNICGGGDGDGICLYSDGVVDIGGGKFVAVFGFDNPASSSVRPNVNQVGLDGGPYPNVQPPPPPFLLSGNHPGGYLPKFEAGHTITWTVNGETVTASAETSRHLQPIVIGTSGLGVVIDGDTIVLRADLGPYATPPTTEPAAENEPQPGDPFNGVLKGEFAVSSNGAATYTVPIAIPPGVAGMAPNLNLVYNSQSVDGIAGRGWELTGLSVIHRCSKTKTQDGFGHPVTADPLDFDAGVCLDGKRMFQGAQSQLDGSVTYTLEQDDHSTITKFFNNPPHVISQPGDLNDAWFKIVTKTGETRYYGKSSRTRVVLPGQTAISVWALERVMDVWGNYFDVHYNKDDASKFGSEGLLVSSIDYTGHVPTGANNGGAVAPFAHVTFDYDPRHETRAAQVSAATLPRNRRLKTITSTLDVNGAETLAGRYDLTYEPDYVPGTPYSLTNDPMLPTRLSSIGYCTIDKPVVPGTLPFIRCMQPLVFEWEGGGYHWDPAPGFAPPAGIERAGDSRDLTHGTQFVDLDGDGRLDFVQSQGLPPSVPLTSHAWRNDGQRWVPTDQWALPMPLVDGGGHRTGATFADIDGDGLPDFITAKTEQCGRGSICLPHAAVWLNRTRRGTGDAWEYHDEFDGPTIHGDPINLRTVDRLADMNGDGKADWVRFGPGDYEVQVRYSNGFGWVVPEENYSVETIASYDPSVRITKMKLEDVNRDGLPDMVWGLAHSLCGDHFIGINTGRNSGTLPRVWDPVQETPNCSGLSDVPVDKRVVGDLGGDGFRDVVSWYRTQIAYATPTYQCVDALCICPDQCGPAGDGTCEGDSCVCICDGVFSTADPQITFATGNSWTANGTSGFQTSLTAFKPHPSDPWVPPQRREDYVFNMADLNADGLADFILNYADAHDQQRGWGRLLVNNGSGFDDLEGAQNWQTTPSSVVGRRVPMVPTEDKDFPSEGGAFIDLDGDGVTDLVQAKMTSSGLQSAAWLNRFKPPTIKKFPNGLARPTEVTYDVITKAGAQTTSPQAIRTYTDLSTQPDVGMTYFITPLRVVASTLSEDGTASGTMFTTQYQYESMRGSRWGRGPQGFAKVRVIDSRQFNVYPIEKKITETTYAQFYPYTGMPTRVEKYDSFGVGPASNSHVTRSRTDTRYCDATNPDPQISPSCALAPSAYPPETSKFVYPITITDVSYLYDGDINSSLVSPFRMARTTDYRYDSDGNPITTTVTTQLVDNTCHPFDTCVQHTRTITNYYETVPGSLPPAELRRVGKPSRTVVTSDGNATTGDAKTHTTTFIYNTTPSVFSDGQSSTSLGIRLVKSRVEPDTPLEVVNAYSHDAFGNVIATVECATQLSFCVPGTTVPEHRKTTVSFDTATFTPPPGGRVTQLGYGDGRFPVRTTNAEGHVEYTAYDPFVGLVTQRTAPNGIHTCTMYDGLGFQRSQTERCGTDHEVTTETDRYIPTSDPFGRFVTRTRAPDRVANWTYSDAFGRTVFVRGRTFDGGFSESFTKYDNWGRTFQQSMPRKSASNEPVFATTTYFDELDRVKTVSRDIGSIDSTGIWRRAIQTFSYHGLSVRTEHNLDGEDEGHLHLQPRVETKNVLGKVQTVQDASNGLMIYSYDADGNLTDTFDGRSTIHIEYDNRGRRKSVDDPDLGHWEYTYDGFGNLQTQTDAKLKQLRMTYDKIGRMTIRRDVDSGQEARWVYDKGQAGVGKLSAMVSEPDDRLRGNCDAPYGLPSGEKRAVRSFTYTPFGELQDTVDCTDGDTFVTSHAYDTLGRESVMTYPQVGGSRLAVRYNYTRLGFLHYVDDATDGSLYWAATARDASGRVKSEYTRNGVETTSTRNQATGWLMASRSVSKADGDKLIQNWGYQFDEAGNLRRRLRADDVNASGSEEIFGYDSLNRLRTSTVNVGTSQYFESYDIDGFGNLTKKGGKPYTYGTDGGCTAGPHAVCTVDGSAPYDYDPNGNLLSDGMRSLRYNLANKVVHVANGSTGVDFMYGADDNRVVQEAVDANATARTVYVGLGATGRSLYERTTRNGTVDHTHFLYSGTDHNGNAFALKIVRETPAAEPAVTMSFNHLDHLGSVTAVSDEQGRVVTGESGGAAATVASYDPWGARRAPDGRPADPASFQPLPGHREFTGHETIPGVGLVNMNGRVYDPSLGRFLSPDPNVQFVGDMQSYNRYSYVLNNPLRYTDPTGYMSDSTAQAIFGVALAVAVAAVCAVSDGAGCVVFELFAVAYSVSSMAAAGASFDQIVATEAIGLMAGIGAGAVVGAVVGPTAPIGVQIVGGAVAGMMSAEMSSVAFGHSLGGDQLLVAAISGAASAGVAAGIRSRPLSQASEAEVEGKQAGLQDTSEFEKKRAEHTAYVKKLAIDNNLVTKEKIGDISVEIYGESTAERKKAYTALKRDLYKGGDVAKEIGQALVKDGRPLEVVLVQAYNSYSTPSANQIVIDVNHDIGGTYVSKVPGGKFTYERIFAHELGHVALGTPSEEGNPNFIMYTVNRSENPIMNALGDSNDRVKY